jgi:hypothetical protein
MPGLRLRIGLDARGHLQHQATVTQLYEAITFHHSRLDQMSNAERRQLGTTTARNEDGSKRRQLYEAITPHHSRLDQMGNGRSDDGSKRRRLYAAITPHHSRLD